VYLTEGNSWNSLSSSPSAPNIFRHHVYMCNWSSGSGISWAICKLAPRCSQITTPAPATVFAGRVPFLPPNQQCQSTEGICCSFALLIYWQLHINILCASEVGGGTAWRNVAAEVGTSGKRDADQSAGDERVGESRSDNRAPATAPTGSSPGWILIELASRMLLESGRDITALPCVIMCAAIFNPFDDIKFFFGL